MSSLEDGLVVVTERSTDLLSRSASVELQGTGQHFEVRTRRMRHVAEHAITDEKWICQGLLDGQNRTDRQPTLQYGKPMRGILLPEYDVKFCIQGLSISIACSG